MPGKRHDWEALEPKLRELLAAREPIRSIASALGVSQGAVQAKMRQLKLTPTAKFGRPTGFKPAVKPLTFDPPKGRMPALNFLLPSELQVDPSYQRSIEGKESQRLIARIAKGWDWSKCLPLLVSDRGEGGLFVIDGQHRWKASILRGDIQQLPCVVVSVGGAEGEAALFDAVNSQRRALTPLELFRASLAAGDAEAEAILKAIRSAGLELAPHENTAVWKPGMISHVGGIRRAWRQFGPAATSAALVAMAEGFPGQVLRYGGTLFGGLPRLVAEGRGSDLGKVLGQRSQEQWRSALLKARAKDPNLNWARAVHLVIGSALRASTPIDEALFVQGKAWCKQCEMRVTLAEATGCKSRFCPLKIRQAA